MTDYNTKIAEYAGHYPDEAQAKEQFNQLLVLAKRRYSGNDDSDSKISDVLGYVYSTCEYVIYPGKNDALKKIVRLLDINGKDIFNLENLLRINEQKISRNFTGTVDAKEVARELEERIVGYRDPKRTALPPTKEHVKRGMPRGSIWQ